MLWLDGHRGFTEKGLWMAGWQVGTLCGNSQMERWRVRVHGSQMICWRKMSFFPTPNGDNLASDFSVGNEVSGIKARQIDFCSFCLHYVGWNPGHYTYGDSSLLPPTYAQSPRHRFDMYSCLIFDKWTHPHHQSNNLRRSPCCTRFAPPPFSSPFWNTPRSSVCLLLNFTQVESNWNNVWHTCVHTQCQCGDQTQALGHYCQKSTTEPYPYRQWHRDVWILCGRLF